MTESRKKHEICPVSLAGSLDNWFRRIFQDPEKIVGPYVREGMTILDLGCGPGFFTLPLARMAGAGGKVIAADLQEGMLEIVRKKVEGTELEGRILLHKCREDSIGWPGMADLVLMFYMAHEVPDRERLFMEVASLLSPGGKVLVVEPPFHVSKKAFGATLAAAASAGLQVVESPRLFLNKAVVFQKG